MALVCFHEEKPHVINQERADIILKIIADTERRKIIISIKDEFKNVNQISEETKLPTSTVYRKIHELKEKNVILSSSKIREDGKREFTYKSKIQKVTMKFEHDDIDVKIYTNLRD